MLRLQRERNQKFGAGQFIDILLGRKTDKIVQYGHDSLTVFGIGTELRESEWRGVVRQLLAQGLLAVEGDYGTLVLTEASEAVLGRQRQVMLRREPERPAGGRRGGRPGRRSSAAAAADLPVEAEGVFERLRAWRAATAKEQGVPAYVDLPRRDAAPDRHRASRPHWSIWPGSAASGRTSWPEYGQQILDTLRG